MLYRRTATLWSSLIVIATWLATALPAEAAIPRTIAYQGVVTSATTGDPINGSVMMTFRLFTEVTGGDAVWEEAHQDANAVVVNGGLFSVQLGSIVPMDLDFDRPYFLEIQLDGDPAMTPRQPLNSVAYSMRAGGGPVHTTVDCQQGSIADAIANAPIGGPLVIDVQGTCNENLVVYRDDITLRGDGNDKIIGVLPNDDIARAVIRLAGARNFILENIAVEGPSGDTSGVTGFSLHDGAGMAAQEGTVIQNMNGACLFAQESSSVDLNDSTVQDCGGNGLSIHRGSHLDSRGSTVRRLGGSGISVFLGASAYLSTLSVSEPGQNGGWAAALSISEGASVRLNEGNVLKNSAATADEGTTVLVYRGSSLRVRGDGNVIENTESINRGTSYSSIGAFAIDAGMNSSLRFDSGRTTIRGNVYSFNLSTVDIRNAEILGNVLADGLNANVRLRPSGSDTVDVRLGNVKVGGSGEISGRSNGIIHDGDLICNFGGVASSLQVINGVRSNCRFQENDLDLSISGPSSVNEQDPFVLTITVSNESLNAQSNLDVRGDVWDHGNGSLGGISDVQVVSGNANCNHGFGHFSCYVDDENLTPSSSLVLEVTVQTNDIGDADTVEMHAYTNVHAGHDVGSGGQSKQVQVVPLP